MIVVDASVAAKWLLPEPGEQQAQELLDGDERLVAPASIQVEVAGAILRQYRLGKLREDDARDLCRFWASLVEERFRLLTVDELFDAALAIAFDLKHALPDCLYLAAAKRLAAGVITADPVLFERGKAVNDRMMLLQGIAEN